MRFREEGIMQERKEADRSSAPTPAIEVLGCVLAAVLLTLAAIAVARFLL